MFVTAWLHHLAILFPGKGPRNLSGHCGGEMRTQDLAFFPLWIPNSVQTEYLLVEWGRVIII
jgi:hypothetical protein